MSKRTTRKPWSLCNCEVCNAVWIVAMSVFLGVICTLGYIDYQEKNQAPAAEIWDNRKGVYQFNDANGRPTTAEIVFNTPDNKCYVHRFKWKGEYYLLSKGAEGYDCTIMKE